MGVYEDYIMYKDTIVAIATPMGYGGIGVIRISGPQAYTLLLKHTTSTRYSPWKLKHTSLLDEQGNILDDILAVYMPMPNTFTGEDVVELHCHGSPIVLKSALEALLQSGARSAERGEFSKRALLNNRMSLSQAEAVMEVIHAPDTVALAFAQKRLQGALGTYVANIEAHLTRARMELYVALDFPEEDLETIDIGAVLSELEEAKTHISYLINQYQQNTVWQEGATVVLAGSVNAGKSSLFNAILGMHRAIVSPIEGTTRDYVTERISLHGLPITLIDTAGLRMTQDMIEQQGIEMMKDFARRADCLLFVVDATRDGLTQEEEDFLTQYASRSLLVYNKIDIDSILPSILQERYDIPTLSCSAHTMEGIDRLMESLYSLLVGSSSLNPDYSALVPNSRQYAILTTASKAIEQLRDDLLSGRPLDGVSAMLEYILQELDEITGYRVPEDILNSIFESFCIGK